MNLHLTIGLEIAIAEVQALQMSLKNDDKLIPLPSAIITMLLYPVVSYCLAHFYPSCALPPGCLYGMINAFYGLLDSKKYPYENYSSIWNRVKSCQIKSQFKNRWSIFSLCLHNRVQTFSSTLRYPIVLLSGWIWFTYRSFNSICKMLER